MLQNGFNSYLEYKIDYNKPVKAKDYSEALSSLNNQYEKFLLYQFGDFELMYGPLCIRQIKQGSILTQLFNDLSSSAIENSIAAAIIVDFGKYLFDKIRNVNKSNNKEDLNDVKNILTPAKQDDNSIEINVTVNGDNNHIVIRTDNLEASRTINDIDRKLSMLNKKLDLQEERLVAITERRIVSKETKIEYQQSLVFRKINSDIFGNAGNFGVISNIADRVTKVTFEDLETKKKMLNVDNNPFGNVYIVDVEVVYRNDKPYNYKVLKLHGIEHS